MPFLNVKVSREVSKEEKEELRKLLLDKTEEILKKKRSVTAIVIESIEDSHWFIGDNSVEDAVAINFEISITKGTNTEEQKAEYLEEVFHGCQRVFSNLSEISYITIKDIEGDSWGFGGISQKMRAKL